MVQYRGSSDQPQTDEQLLEDALKAEEEQDSSTPKQHVKEFFLELRQCQRKRLDYAEQLIADRNEPGLKHLVDEVFSVDAKIRKLVDLSATPPPSSDIGEFWSEISANWRTDGLPITHLSGAQKKDVEKAP